MQIDKESLLAQLAKLPDPRRRQGRRYPLAALLALVLIGVLQGQSSLRGCWVWARAHWLSLWQPLGFGSPHFGALTTLWNLLVALEPQPLEQLFAQWLEELLDYPTGGLSADGKVLRGSRRDGLVGIQLVSLVHHQLGIVLGQQRVEGGDGELGALLKLLKQTSLAGHVLTLDAGLLQSGVTRVVPKRDGNYLGVVKDNHREVKAAIDRFLEANTVSSDIVLKRGFSQSLEKNRGRLEERKLKVKAADDLQDYLAREYGWWHVKQVGWIRRRQQRRAEATWSEERVTFVTSLSPSEVSPQQLLELLRGHWCIENNLHWVRDVTYDEDQKHARKTGQALAWARNIAISLIRYQGFEFIPDGWQWASANPATSITWLTSKLKHSIPLDKLAIPCI